MQNLSELIYEKRKAAGYTQEKLAELSNVNRITIRRYENGDFKNLDFKQLFDISKALNFNLITYLSVFFEGLSMEQYSKLVLLYNMIINLQKKEVEEFLNENDDDGCFKSKIGRELYFYAKALVEIEKKEYKIALHKCYAGLGVDISMYDIKDINSKSVIFLRLMILSASCLLKMDYYQRSEQIYYQVYNFISDIDFKDNIFKSQLFYTDFTEYQIVILCNLTHIYVINQKYNEAIDLCEKAINLMFQNKTYKFFYSIFVNKALALYRLTNFYEAKLTLLQVYHYLISINEMPQIENFKSIVIKNFPAISYITSYMTEPDLRK